MVDFLNYLDKLIESRQMNLDEHLREYIDFIESHFNSCICDFYLIEQLFEFFDSDLSKNIAYEITCFMPLLCQRRGRRFSIKQFVELSCNKCVTSLDSKKTLQIAVKVIVLGLCLGIINCDIGQNISFPTIGIDNYPTQDEKIQKLIFYSKILVFLNSPESMCLDFSIYNLEIFVVGSFANMLTVYCSKYDLEHHIQNENTFNETREKLNEQRKEIQSLHLRIIEIISIIIAVFSIIGVNVFSLSNNEEKILFENIALINLTLVLSIVVIFGLIGWLIKKEPLPNGYITLIVCLVIALVLFSCFNENKEIVFNINSNLETFFVQDTS